MVGVQAQSATPTEFLNDPELAACLDKGAPKKALEQRLSVETFDESTFVSRAVVDVFWKRFDDSRTRGLLRFLEPSQKRGLALLVTEKDEDESAHEMIMYLPELRTTRRIVGRALSGALFGTDFSYEDFVHLQAMQHNRTSLRLADDAVFERASYVLETRPQTKGSKYTRIVSFVDKQWCTPTLMKFYADGDAVIKELSIDFDEVREVSGRMVAHRLRLSDLVSGSRTEIHIDNIEFDPDLPDTLFSVARLRQGK